MVQEIITKSWGSRIASSFMGVLFGILLIIGSCILIFWNEGNSLHTAQSLQEAKQVLISIPSTPINPANNKKVVYLTGEAVTKDMLEDSKFGVSENALKLERKAQMYQWKENKETKSESQTGGSEKETTTYTYQQVWSDELIDSSQFKEASEHQNPNRMEIKSKTQYANKITVGDFVLPTDLIYQLSNAKPVNLSDSDVSELETELNKPVKHDGDDIYIGSDPSMPKIGDLKISFLEILPQSVSIIAEQTGNTLQPFNAKAGRSVSLLSMGEVSSDQMIFDAINENNITTWILRIVSLAMMIIGIALLMGPIVAIFEVLPFLGSIASFGTGLIALLSGLILWSLLTAIAWITVRPLWAVGLIIIVAAICYLIIKRRKKGIQNASNLQK